MLQCWKHICPDRNSFHVNFEENLIFTKIFTTFHRIKIGTKENLNNSLSLSYFQSIHFDLPHIHFTWNSWTISFRSFHISQLSKICSFWFLLFYPSFVGSQTFYEINSIWLHVFGRIEYHRSFFLINKRETEKITTEKTLHLNSFCKMKLIRMWIKRENENSLENFNRPNLLHTGEKSNKSQCKSWKYNL